MIQIDRTRPATGAWEFTQADQTYLLIFKTARTKAQLMNFTQKPDNHLLSLGNSYSYVWIVKRTLYTALKLFRNFRTKRTHIETKVFKGTRFGWNLSISPTMKNHNERYSGPQLTVHNPIFEKVVRPSVWSPRRFQVEISDFVSMVKMNFVNYE